jgi:hypothetical protein
MPSLRFRHALSLFLGLSLVAGCGSSGPKLYRVTGTVKYKSEPIKNGTISFRSLDGMYAATGNLVNGEYDIAESAGLPEGKYQVAVTSPDPKGPAAPAAGEMPGDSTAVAKDLIPAKYNAKSELSAEIKAQPRNEVNFDLK